MKYLCLVYWWLEFLASSFHVPVASLPCKPSLFSVSYSYFIRGASALTIELVVKDDGSRRGRRTDPSTGYKFPLFNNGLLIAFRTFQDGCRLGTGSLAGKI